MYAHVSSSIGKEEACITILAIMETASNTHEQTWGTQLVTYKTHDTGGIL